MSHLRVGNRIQLIWWGWRLAFVWGLPFPRPDTLRRNPGLQPFFWHYAIGPLELRWWREPMPKREVA